MIKKALIWLMAMSAVPAFADDGQVKLPFNLSQSELTQLSNDAAWRRLLFADNASGKSEIADARFFVHTDHQGKPNGDSTSELVAMLGAMAAQDKAVMCRFVARTHFLQQALLRLGKPQADDFDLRDCDDFESWRQAMDIRHLSLIFAEESSENLASAFAHTLIRADRADLSDGGATAINYTVGSDERDGALKSVAKSITGGYAGELQISPFTQKSQEYLGNHRTLWQYRLRLDDHEIEQIVRHLWEIRQIKRPYFFTHDNCATEIVRLIDLVRTQDNVRAKIGKIVLPNVIVRTLVDENLAEQGQFISNRQAVPNWADPALSWSNYRGKFAMAWQDDKPTAIVGVRGAYHDQLDGVQGVRAYHDIELLSGQLAVNKDGVAIDRATLFASQRLRGDGDDVVQSAQAMHAGLMSVIDASDRQNDRHLVLDLSMAKGKSWQISPISQYKPAIGAVCYLLGGGVMQFGRLNQGYRLGVTGDVGCVYGDDGWRGKLQFGVPYYFHHDSSPSRSHYVQPYVLMQAQYDVSKQTAVRFDGRVDFGFADYKPKYALSLLKYF